ncbi:hypothetical protein KCP77_01475 [Salmonella enterica subsp. enterica]|nr:hypothetical protein KCP77_01475 [Salmonella enterica subsp. enterica]
MKWLRSAMVGGRPSKQIRGVLFSFEFFRNRPVRLLKFPAYVGTHWNISLFIYRSHGTDYGRVLAAFEGLGDRRAGFPKPGCMSWAMNAMMSNNPAFGI